MLCSCCRKVMRLIDTYTYINEENEKQIIGVYNCADCNVTVEY